MFPIIPANSVTAVSGNQEGVFGFGRVPSLTTHTNLVSDVGVVATDVAAVGGARDTLAACEYGVDKGIFGFGRDAGGYTSSTCLVTNVGVVGSDVAGVGTARMLLAACSYGEDKGMFGYGHETHSITNKVSDAGVVASDTAGVGTDRYALAATEYGEDKGIFGYGADAGAGYIAVAITNLVSNTGVVAADQAATTGTGRWVLAATQYGGDKGIFGFGSAVSDAYVGITNLVSNTAVVADDVAAVGTARGYIAACSFN